MPDPSILTPHPETGCDAVRKIEASALWSHDGSLAVGFALTGDLSRLSIPPLGPTRKSDRLWEHTCFEAFVAVKDSPAYYEFNFAPSGEWAAYAFRSYREPMPLAEKSSTAQITAESAGESLQLDASLWMDCLMAIHPGARLSVALSAVIEDNRGRLSYWALKHPARKPDFHHRDGFALEMERPAKTR
jgi:hypothetical protein